MEEIIGYVSSGLIGISLGLIGGGGSILMVPVLVYLFHIEPAIATGHSLVVIGATAFIGAIRSAICRHIDFKISFAFALPGIITVYILRSYVLPTIPSQLEIIDGLVIMKDVMIMVVFAIIMLVASLSMIVLRKQEVINEDISINYFYLILLGILIGVLTAVVGAGGGFLIIPALVLFAKLPMKKAVGSSLAIIALNAFVGIMGDLNSNHSCRLFRYHYSCCFSSGRLIHWLLPLKIYSRRKIEKDFWMVCAYYECFDTDEPIFVIRVTYVTHINQCNAKL